jgi:hypothetical protein
MCALGRLHGSAREVLAFVVVDGPRGRARFGADVAGPTAIGLLRRAFGLGASGGEPGEEPDLELDGWWNTRDLPWADGGED